MYARKEGNVTVTVEHNGEHLLTIEPNCVFGKELTKDDDEIIRQAARHLLAFVGQTEEEREIFPGGDVPF